MYSKSNKSSGEYLITRLLETNSSGLSYRDIPLKFYRETFDALQGRI